ncbi:cytochrome c peroxidase [Rhodocytophaga aerolata]|uniref:Cytochrome c peroxidase n=1 Tax=Rhodocytophaga aerolata TaxID=455078 RepID=A0ABT8RGC6_9BACT|nr:cytochrome c peroxidase [Rhodocytophaga aerolata]MDO1451161.1 cytochrome c peroxidase [Rhodocytophaga aerolata]
MPKRNSVEEPEKLTNYPQHITQLDSTLSDLLRLVTTNSSADSIQAAFRKARIGYKKIEFIAEYFNPYTAKAINGAAIYEVEEDDPLQKLVPPTGFQVAEAFVFPAYDSINKKALVQEIKLIKSSLNRLRLVNETTAISDRHIFDAMRQQLFRIISLGISGFDSPIALHSMPEAAASVQSLQETFALYKPDLQKISPDLSQKIESTFSEAIAYLQTNTDFTTFDRAAFITTYANPLTTYLAKARDALGIATPADLRAFSSKAYTLFDEGAFNVNFYAPSYQAHLTPERIALGKMLFFDPVLSGNGSRSCASCHIPEKGFADGKAKSIAFDFKGSVSRNAPTLLNAALQSSLFHDMRVNFLEDQASEVVNNTNEMHGSFKEAVVLVKQSQEYVHLFEEAFPESADSSLTEQHIKVAIASYVRSLTSLNSRFDQYMKGDKTTLTTLEVKGFNVFMGKAKCGTCHFMPLFNGAVPPNFAQTEAEILGVPGTTDTLHPELDADLGKFDLYKKDLHKYAFKTPTVRNVALTAPYMHNGVYSTLEEVIDFYNRGGGQGMGIDLPTQTLPPDKLDLNTEEKEALVAFMQTLTDTTGLTDVPRHLPLFPNQVVLNKRKVGGKY